MTARRRTLLGACLLALACAGEPETPEQRIRALLSSLEQQAQARDAGEMKQHVSESYTDAQGNDKRAVAQLVALQLLRNESVHLLTRVLGVEIRAPDAARAEVLVAMAGTEIDGPEALVALHADLYRFGFDLREEDGEWRIRSAEWRPASAADFR